MIAFFLNIVGSGLLMDFIDSNEEVNKSLLSSPPLPCSLRNPCLKIKLKQSYKLSIIDSPTHLFVKVRSDWIWPGEIDMCDVAKSSQDRK